MNQPSKQEMVSKLQKILSGELTREEVSTWAMLYIDNDELEIDDFAAWEFLKEIGGIDVIEAPDVYLYGDEDINKWISENSDI
jgi:hypothetical protein